MVKIIQDCTGVFMVIFDEKWCFLTEKHEHTVTVTFLYIAYGSYRSILTIGSVIDDVKL